MRILHTADWHLNERLGRIERQTDIVARLKEIAGYLDEHRVDVMVVAGDVFSRFTRLEEVRDALKDVQATFKPFLARGGTIVALSGNHDHEALFTLLWAALDLASPLDPHSAGPLPSGRLYLAAQPTLLELADEAGQRVQFALLPYPTPSRYLRDENTRFTSLDERNRALHQALVRKVDRLRALVNPGLPSLLVGHLHLRGSEVHNLYHVSEREDVVFDAVDLPMNWAYMAFGHIHKPQTLLDTSHARYSGSIERLDYAERDDQKGVVLVDIGAAGLVDEPMWLPLNATPIYHIELTDPLGQLPLLPDRYPDASRALVSYRLIYQPGEHNRDAICRELAALFPRCYREEILTASSPLVAAEASITAARRDVPGTVRSYLQARLAQDPDRDAILALADELLAGR